MLLVSGKHDSEVARCCLDNCCMQKVSKYIKKTEVCTKKAGLPLLLELEDGLVKKKRLLSNLINIRSEASISNPMLLLELSDMCR